MQARQIIEQVQATGACIQLEGESITVEPLSVVNAALVDQIKKNRTGIYRALRNTFTRLVELTIEKAWMLYEQRVAEPEVLRLIGDTSGLKDCTATELDGWACALALRTVQAKQMVPTGWNRVANCPQCGSVWSEHELPILSCGWCWMREAKMMFPQP